MCVIRTMMSRVRFPTIVENDETKKRLYGRNPPSFPERKRRLRIRVLHGPCRSVFGNDSRSLFLRGMRKKVRLRKSKRPAVFGPK